MKHLKNHLLIIIILFCFGFQNVSAAYDGSAWFTNDYGVVLNKDEYDFITEFYYEGFQNYIDKELYNVIFADSDIISSKIEKVSNISELIPYSSVHQTASKKLTISSACTSSCLISINVEWLKSPVIRSYDVIGAYLSGVKLSTVPNTKVINSTGSNTTSTYNLDDFGHGFGTSIMLLPSGSDMKITQTFRTNGKGKIYGSYQHATSDVTLEQSQNYTISRTGYGGVFLFDNSVRDYYDGMAGVSIDI